MRRVTTGEFSHPRLLAEYAGVSVGRPSATPANRIRPHPKPEQNRISSVQQVCDEQERQAALAAEAAARWFARKGIAASVERLHHPIRYEDDPDYHTGCHTAGNDTLEGLRATAVAELRPHVERLTVKPVTIRQALVASLAPIEKRPTYKTNRRIEKKSAGSVREEPLRPLRLVVQRRDESRARDWRRCRVAASET
jgi:hypothetical protein